MVTARGGKPNARTRIQIHLRPPGLPPVSPTAKVTVLRLNLIPPSATSPVSNSLRCLSHLTFLNIFMKQISRNLQTSPCSICFLSSAPFERAGQNPHPQEQYSGPSTRTSYTRTGLAIPQTTSTTPLPPLLAPPSEFKENHHTFTSPMPQGPEPTLTIHRRTHRIFRTMIDPAPHGSTRRYGRGAKLLQAEPKRSGPDPAERGPPLLPVPARSRRLGVCHGRGRIGAEIGHLGMRVRWRKDDNDNQKCTDRGLRSWGREMLEVQGSVLVVNGSGGVA